MCQSQSGAEARVYDFAKVPKNCCDDGANGDGVCCDCAVFKSDSRNFCNFARSSFSPALTMSLVRSGIIVSVEW